MCHTRRFAHLLILCIVLNLTILSACTPQSPVGLPIESSTTGDISSAAAAQLAATRFLEAWQTEAYAEMYAMLSSISQDALSQEAFTNAYQEAARSLTLQGLSFDILSALGGDRQAEVAFSIEFDTQLLGVIRRKNVAHLALEAGAWRIKWENSLILPELKDGMSLALVQQTPSRGQIFDRQGVPLASYENAIAIGVVPGELNSAQADLVFETLAEISAYNIVTLRQMIESTPDDWYLPIVSLSQENVQSTIERLRELQGVRINEFRSRFYVDSGVAPHALGYMAYIPEDALEDYLRLGYRQDERIGGAGLEAVYEAALSGQRGGSLYLISSEGELLSLLAASEPEPGQSLYTTLDKTLQMRLQDTLGDLRGAVAVMEVDTGRLLALVSSPSFDPNAFDMMEKDQGLLDSYFTNPDQPLFNRTTQGQYPLGSVFKAISMSAALESELFRSTSSFFCGQSLWVCDSVTLYDWTYSHGIGASGELTLPEGLMRSCNPWFYHIGETLYSEGMESTLSAMAVGFGLGQQTGIEILEAAGNIPETAETCVESAQIAIGQGRVLVTPLQVVSFFGAIANGGTLYRPALVERIQTLSSETTYEFTPQSRGELPLSAPTLASVQEGLRLVVEAPLGTGYGAMESLVVPVSGKTGTAQTSNGNPHAWFAGYTRLDDPERPDIAVVVLMENGGEGSVMAAPVFRRAVSLYFSDAQDPGGLMPWEIEPYISKTPDPTGTPTIEE
jgi:penicillin-binding protein 2